jgi:hypothetical protein
MLQVLLPRTPSGLNTTVAVVILALLHFPSGAYAVPSMGRQTGMECSVCHTVYPQLTPFGRQFKLGGFSMSIPKPESKFPAFPPLSGLLQVSMTASDNTKGADGENFPHDGEVILQAAGVYYGGKMTDKSGALVQFFYDGIERRFAMEMFDMRYADSFSFANNKKLLYGITLNNNPTVSDIYNSTPQWSFPHTESAALLPAASTVIDMSLASQVGGIGVYALWDNLLYAEVDLYRSARHGLFRPLGAGVATENVVQDFTPYWRLALQHEWGLHSLEVGTYGLVTDIFPDPENPTGQADHFIDTALDAQYQFIDTNHIFTTSATWIHETQDWNASFSQDRVSNQSDTLQTFRMDFHYYYQRRFGGGVQYFSTWGDRDDLKYSTGEQVTGSVRGRPNSNGLMAELNYLPWQYLKLALRYTAYAEFNGAAINYDGFGRNASDNNSLFLLGWLMF